MLECKLDIDFRVKADRDKVILQVVHYLNNIHFNSVYNRNGFKELPKVVLVGSKINCFALASKYLWDYYAVSSYKGAASTFHSTEEGRIVLERISKDNELEHKTIVYNTEDKNCMADIVENILKYAQDLDITEDLSEKTLSKAFDFFEKDILTEKQSNSMTSRQKAEMFMQFVLNPDLCEEKTSLLRLNNPETELILNGNIIKVNRKQWNTFRVLYRFREYSKLEQKKITAITDRLIEDSDRRRKGDFYTPTVWVEEAHKLITKNIGDQWRKDYIVWDCAWGTGNLTRDYNDWGNLYCSTLQSEDLSIGEKYNRGATKFQYDFLNDDVYEFESVKAALKQPFMFKNGFSMDSLEQYLNFKDIQDLYAMAVDKNIITTEEAMNAYSNAVNILKRTKLYNSASSLIEQLIDPDNKRELMFLINPPYGTSAEMKNVHSKVEHKVGIGDTNINSMMASNKVGTCSRQLIAQFLYRIDTMQRMFGIGVKTGMFSPTSVVTSNDYANLLGILDRHMAFTDGLMFLASEFADVKSNWAIMFSLYTSINNEHNRECKVKVMSTDVDFIPFYKVLYMIDKSKKASWWVKSTISEIEKSKDVLYLKSALNVHDGKPHNMCIKGSIGGFISSANNVNENTQFVALLSSMSGAAKGLNLGKENYDMVISYFTARRLISGQYATWINSKDEYMIPNTEHPKYEQWQQDCIVYSLFNTSSNQSSLRNIEYNSKIWNIYNEFFFMSRKDIEGLAGGEYSTEDINNSIEEDLEIHGTKERFVFEKLQQAELSDDARKVLEKAIELVKSSFKHRKQFNIEHPEYHINTWDAGWYQIKGMLKQYDKKGLDEFNKLYKELEDRMRPLVYELGFLYK